MARLNAALILLSKTKSGLYLPLGNIYYNNLSSLRDGLGNRNKPFPATPQTEGMLDQDLTSVVAVSAIVVYGGAVFKVVLHTTVRCLSVDGKKNC